MSMRRSSRTKQRKWFHFLPLLLVVSVGSFVVGTRFVATRPPPLTHPLTGRIIPGIATDAAWMDRPERQREEAPDRALQLLGIAPGMSVADVGAGTGYMTTRIAKLVGPMGSVYANEIQPAMLRMIEAKASLEHLANIQVVQGTDDDTRLPSRAIDVALLVDVYHELRHPQAILQSVRNSLKPHGDLVVIEYRKEDPTIPIADTHRMSITEMRAEIEAAGFTFDRVIEELPRQHILVFHSPTS
jgi:predicted methyltransferase